MKKPGAEQAPGKTVYSTIAFTGQLSTQVLQSVQSSVIWKISPDSTIAPTGQESTHVPQEMQSSVIFMVSSSRY